MSLAKDFRDFILRGNVVDLAVGVVIGAAFNTVVQSFTKGIITPLVVTSNGGGLSTGQVFISPDQPFRRDSLRSRLMAVQINAKAGSDTSLHGRLVVVGNAVFPSDRYTGRVFYRGPDVETGDQTPEGRAFKDIDEYKKITAPALDA